MTRAILPARTTEQWRQYFAANAAALLEAGSISAASGAPPHADLAEAMDRCDPRCYEWPPRAAGWTLPADAATVTCAEITSAARSRSSIG